MTHTEEELKEITRMLRTNAKYPVSKWMYERFGLTKQSKAVRELLNIVGDSVEEAFYYGKNT